MKDLDFVLQNKVVAIVRGLPSERMCALAEALLAGGIHLMEVTFAQNAPETWKDTCAAISMLSNDFKGRILPGAGTVMSKEQLLMARDAGARYIISPNADESIIRETKALGLLSFPGAFTPSEIADAHAWGADIVKVFPASVVGPAYIKAIRAPISHIPLMAVGGVNEKNAGEFIKSGCVGLGVGGNLVNKSWIENGEWDKITSLACEYGKAVL